MELDGIAIVGLAAQLPSGSSGSADLNYATFWDFLVTGGSAYEPLKDILPDLAYPQLKLPARGTFLKNATSFDNISLGISTRDARVIPYSARRLLDLSFQAVLDSGIESRGRNIGCFMSGNRPLQGENPVDPDGSVSSWMPHSIANRISYALDLTGPSIYLDTACSSSLTAIHLAIGAIERGDCVAALVGAAQINRDPFEWAAYAQAGGILSSDGICRPFDAAAGGFGRGEGAVVIVLKPLKDAMNDHDHIYSVVLGSAINVTGSRLPLNVPNGTLITSSYMPQTNAASKIFATDRSVMFGSVKGNIGHLEVAAFLASLVKACLIFKHGIIPPTVNFSNPVDTIDWDAFQIVVPVEPTPLGCRSSSGRSIISLSGFALGGATGHVVLQAPPPLNQTTTEIATAPILFLVGGLSSNAVDQISRGVLEMTDDQKSLGECAVTLSRRARQLPWRKYFTIPVSPRMAIALPALIPRETFPLAFVFSGQGPQHLEMGRQLFAEFPVFRNTIIELDDVYRHVKGVSLITSTGLFALAGSQFTAPTITLPDFGWPVVITLSAIAMVQLAMFDLLKSVGVLPDMILGHSAGETAILYASGAGPKEMAMEIAIARGEAMTPTESEQVGMVVVACSAKRALELIAHITDDTGILELSCFNAPESITVSGAASLLDKLVILAKHQEIFAQRIRTMVPVHSSFMDCIKDDYMAKMDEIFSRYPGSHVPRIPVYSTCCEERFVEAFTSSYFWDNCRNPVLFSKAISHVLASSPVFLEISCHAVLSSSILARGVPDGRVLCPMRRISPKKGPSLSPTEPEVFLDTLGRLSLLGLNSLDLSGLYGPSEFKPKFIEHPVAVRDIPPPKGLSHRRQSTADSNGPLSSSNLHINKVSHPTLAEHVINGEPILPSTAFIELLLESGANFLWDVEFVSSLLIPATSPLEISLQRLDSAWSVRTGQASLEQEHARGFMDRSPPNKFPPVMDCESIFKRLPLLDLDGFYPSLEPLAAYGPRFQRIVRCHGRSLEAIAEIKGPTQDELSDGYLLHPAIMDACIHVLHHTDISKQYSKDIIYLPSQVEHFNFYRPNQEAGNWLSRINFRQWTPDSRYYDILITNSSGLALCEFRNLKVQMVTWAAPMTVGRRFDLIFQPLAVNANIPTIPISFPERTDKHEIKLLYETLDCMAVAIISKSLGHGVVLGEDKSRGRYLNFARQALRKVQDIHLSPDILQNLRDNWPYHFEITSRIAAVHEAVREASQKVTNALYSDDLMAKYYSKNSQTSNVCNEAARAFSGILESLRTSGKKSIKILEVGAGPGFLTSPLIDEIKQNHGDKPSTRPALQTRILRSLARI
ncbi:beta-ketoacyl synthase [Mycena vulgaris]|nr:beta-ketoacyl synthase [Mycena vulgaris]